ncbi:phenylalanine--tRNA ligase subunit beta [Estrella lausannensis]|uniref:Phenylalanine--tRNA ligase beta subunit n=1 Tax=Estrella lausannensis TaxID=483423 RepID=A0A0H5DND3_9BACT|nr:phenylalanine--tRNA ligase subunit beta [Estrella lausannensis]CRX37811.1 Phenylalanyl-tRNA synthetase, beta subunit [Estrella lausannensis]
MKVPLGWLKEFAQIEMDPQEIAKWLTLAGLEVEAIESFSLGFQDVVIAEVVEAEKHPNADKLTLAQVFDGQDSYAVVCGAPNCRKGLRTAFAKPGATLIDDQGKSFKIKKTKIRGVESSGMLLSAKELGIGENHDGILELDNCGHLGASLAELLKEIVLEVSLTPNLGHCASIQGLARELHAKAGVALIERPLCTVQNRGEPIEQSVKIKVGDIQGCPRYACRLIRDVTIGPSPKWLQNRLEAAGIRPVNNIVDATNYTLIELGHPLHAFDFDKIQGGEVHVRKAREHETLVTLDGKERILHPEDLLIADQERPLAIAGVMGGEDSEVKDHTKNILLESAYFDSVYVRKTSKRQGLITEASRRFERGTDPNLVIKALDRCTALIEELSGGVSATGAIDVKNGDFKEKSMTLRLSRTGKMLGKSISQDEVESIFKRLGFDISFDGEDLFNITVPTYRNDIKGEIDLIEEVARIYGYDHFKTGTIRFQPSDSESNGLFLFEREIRARLVAEGLQEYLTCDLIGPKILDIVYGSDLPDEPFVKVLNPTSIEQSILRTTLLPGMLQAAKFNSDRQCANLASFEIGRIHYKEGNQYIEEVNIAIMLSGLSRPWHFDRKPSPVDYFDLKGIVENLLKSLEITNQRYKNLEIKTYHDGRQASIFAGDVPIGVMGEIHPAILRRLDVPNRILFAEISLKELFRLKSKMTEMKPLNLYPASERDWTLTLPISVTHEVVRELIGKMASPLLEQVHLIDLWQSPKLGEGMKNLTYRFVYRDVAKTISQEVVDQEHARITDGVRSLITSAAKGRL